MADDSEVDLGVEEDVSPASDTTIGDAPAVNEAPTGDDATPETKPKPHGGFQRRISELTASRNRERSEKERLLSLLEHQSQSRQLAPDTNAKDRMPERGPDEGYDDYVLRAARWEASQTVKEALNKQADEAKAVRKAEREEAARQTWNERASKTAEKYEDFDDVVSDDSLPISKAMARAISVDDLGPEIAYYLGKHLDEAAKLYRIKDSALVAVQIGKLSERLANKKPPIESKAPKPVTPIGGRAKATDAITNDLSTGEWIKRDRERMAKARQR